MLHEFNLCCPTGGAKEVLLRRNTLYVYLTQQDSNLKVELIRFISKQLNYTVQENLNLCAFIIEGVLGCYKLVPIYDTR